MVDRPQFHHYIPRFILRRWAVDRGGLGDALPSSSGKKPQRLNVYDRVKEELIMGSASLATSFGLYDMYKDTKHQTDMQHVEKALSVLEGRAAAVVTKLVAGSKKLWSKSREITLTRAEVNVLRKFLFIMNYRNGARFRQFSEGRFDEETGRFLRAFIEEHDLEDSHAAWLFNLRNLLDLKHHEVQDSSKVFAVDRLDYTFIAKDRQLSIYEMPPSQEIILTESGFGLWEGNFHGAKEFAVSVDKDWDEYASALTSRCNLPQGLITRESVSAHFQNLDSAQLTLTFPISPKVVIILRMIALTMEPHLRIRDPDFPGFTHLDSYFSDFPKPLADVHYNPPLSGATKAFRYKVSKSGMKIQPGDLTANENRIGDDWNKGIVDGAQLLSREKDTLTFTINRLSSEQGHKVNCLFLDNCDESLAFTDPIMLEQSLTAYNADLGMWKRDWTILKTKLVTLRNPPAPPSQTHGVHRGPVGGTKDDGGQAAVEKPKKKSKKEKKKVNVADASTKTVPESRDTCVSGVADDLRGVPPEGHKDADGETKPKKKKSKRKKKGDDTPHDESFEATKQETQDIDGGPHEVAQKTSGEAIPRLDLAGLPVVENHGAPTGLGPKKKKKSKGKKKGPVVEPGNQTNTS